MFRDLLDEAYGAMRHNRRRATLTMLGMAWGIATVILLMAYGAASARPSSTSSHSFGSESHRRFSRSQHPASWRSKSGSQGTLDGWTIDRLSATVPNLKHITPEMYLRTTAVQTTARAASHLPVTGTAPPASDIRKLDSGNGTLF